ncbi:MAG: hypothetical protein ACT6XY_21345 [Phreatobacter sp.]|uniref:hypothetical protein n=1 Tax=Phreatobacter sp. TaxID=1966341 RepID=UPI0040363161
MSIGFTGHCSLAPEEAQARLRALAASRPDLFGGLYVLTPATAPPEPFGADISRDFGIAARCWFRLLMPGKGRDGPPSPEVVELLYQVFGTDHLIVTWELDTVVPPPASCPPTTAP